MRLKTATTVGTSSAAGRSWFTAKDARTFCAKRAARSRRRNCRMHPQLSADPKSAPTRSWNSCHFLQPGGAMEKLRRAWAGLALLPVSAYSKNPEGAADLVRWYLCSGGGPRKRAIG